MPKFHPIALLVVAVVTVNFVLIVAGQPAMIFNELITPQVKSFISQVAAGVCAIVMLFSYAAFYTNNNNSKTA